MTIASVSFILNISNTGIQKDTEDETGESMQDFLALKKQKSEEIPSRIEVKETQEIKQETKETNQNKTVEEVYNEAMQLLDTNQYHEGIKQLQELATGGYHFAQSQLGKLYLDGKLVAHNEGKAHEWNQKAAEQGNIDA